MGKLVISKLFLYRHRFLIGYILLGLAFFALLFGLPLITPNGLSESEMQSTVIAENITTHSIFSGDIVDLPYHLLQKLCLTIFGLNPYSLKLPSIIIGALLGLLLVLLLNRWFKNNVAIMASIVTVLSSSFLYVSGSGTPLIMFIFWPVLLLWLGSKIQGNKKPKPFYSFIFAFALLGSIFTPYLIYLAIFIVLFVLINPHLRFTVKSLPKFPFIIITLIIATGCTFIIMNAIQHPDTVATLFLAKDFSWDKFFPNIGAALAPFLSWNGMVESTFLAPLISLPTLALAIIGLLSTAKGFFASRNSIATYLIIFSIIVSGFRPDFAILLILPIAILVAHGLRYILNKWYGIFPENPYARIFGVLPIALFMSIMIFSDIFHFYFGYRYNPSVSNQFTADLALIQENLKDGDVLLIEKDTLEYEFYSIYAKQSSILGTWRNITITDDAPPLLGAGAHLVTLGKWDVKFDGYHLSHIVTSGKSQNSDRLYVYNMVNN